jgi:hypothetical protein
MALSLDGVGRGTEEKRKRPCDTFARLGLTRGANACAMTE